MWKLRPRDVMTRPKLVGGFGGGGGDDDGEDGEIGRASCRERVSSPV